MDKALVARLMALRERIEAHFNSGDWVDVGLLTDTSDIVEGHRRLFRSLDFGDEDYSNNVLEVLRNVADRNIGLLDEYENFVDRKYPAESHYISAKPATKKLTFAPHVFELTDISVEPDLVALMMPFSAEFESVHQAIVSACKDAGLRCLRVDDVWEESTIIQDIFNLLIRAKVVVVDFSGKNPNVMYETGIAHTLGKLVIPLTQSMGDVPFDVKHHRVLKYLSDCEGLEEMRASLAQKLGRLNQ